MKTPFLRAKSSRYILNIDGWDLLENFFICAILSILVLRFFLRITGYPQVGGGNLHIAHMLWGGLLMLVAIIQMFIFISRDARQLASIVGGVGFGMFIDELGKFITSDNDYFYQPTIALIYGIFVVIFLVAKVMFRRTDFSGDDYLANTLDVIKDRPLASIDENEKQKALSLLEKCDTGNNLVSTLTDAIKNTEPAKVQAPNLFGKIKTYTREKYLAITHNKRFTVGFFILFVMLSIADFLIGPAYVIGIPSLLKHELNVPFSFSEIIIYVTSMVSSALVVLGLVLSIIKRSRIILYEMSKYAVLISILFTQFFLFYKEQLVAITALLINIVLYVIIRYMISQEKTIRV